MDDEDNTSNTKMSIPSNNTTLTKSAVSPRKTIEHQLIKTTWIFRIALWFDNHKYNSCALWLYSIYIRNPRNEQYLGAVNNSAIIYYNELKDYHKALSMYDKLGTQQIIARGYEFHVALCFDQKEPPDYENAKKWYKLCIEGRTKRDGNTENCQSAYNNLATIYCHEKNWMEVLKYAELLGEEYIVNKNWEFEIALAAYYSEQWISAIYYWILYTKNPESKAEGILSAYQNVGKVYRKIGKYKESLEWYLKIDIDELIKRNQEGYIGHCYIKLDDNENAVKWLKMMVNNPKTKDNYDRKWISNCYKIIGLYYNEKNEPKKAINEGWSYMNDEEVIQNDCDLHIWLSYVGVEDVEMQLKYLKIFMDRKGDKTGDQWNSRFASVRNDIVEYLKELKERYVEHETEIDLLLDYFKGITT